MIDFSLIKHDEKVLEDIKSIGNSCGVVSIYFLSLIFNTEFDIEEFKNIGKGLTHHKIQQWATKHGIQYASLDTEKYKRSFKFCKYDFLLKNDIVFDLSGLSFKGNNSPHTTLIKDVTDEGFKLLFSEHKFVTAKEVKGLYCTIYYKKGVNVHKYIKFYNRNVFACIKSFYERFIHNFLFPLLRSISKSIHQSFKKF